MTVKELAVEMRQGFARIEKRLEGVEARLEGVEEGAGRAPEGGLARYGGAAESR